MSQIQNIGVSGGGGGAGTVEFLAGNTGGNVGPNGSNVIDVVGGTGITVVGTPLTNTLTINSTTATNIGFSAYLSTTQNNVTGDGTYYQVPYDTVLYDLDSNYNPTTGVFTAPVTGQYVFSAASTSSGIGTAIDMRQMIMTTSNSYTFDGDFTTTNGLYSTTQTVQTSMTAGDTAFVKFYVYGTGSKTANALGFDGINIWCSFSGHLLSSSSGGPEVNQKQIYYVGKHGNDTNSGLNIENAKLTFGSAITAAAALTPSSTNMFAIVCYDDGVYTENITGAEYIDIYAPNATLVGTLTLTDLEHVKFKVQNYTGSGYAVVKSTGSSYLNLEIDTINLGTSTNGISCTSGFANFTWKQLYVVNGYGIGNYVAGGAHIHLNGGDIYITGTGYAVASFGTNSTVGRIDHILDAGTGAGHGIQAVNGEIDLNISRIDGLATAMTIGTTSLFSPVANLQVNLINCTQAYTVGATGTLNLDCSNITGTTTVTSGGNFNQGVYAGGGYGTAGQVLTSTGPTTPPTFQTGIQSATVTLTSAQIQNLLGTPITVVPAQGANTIIVPTGVTAKFVYGGNNAFTGTSNVVLTYATHEQALGILMPNAAITGTANAFSLTVPPSTNTGEATGNIDNQAVMVNINPATNLGGNASADNTLIVNMNYFVSTL